jgi:hypothetical protein
MPTVARIGPYRFFFFSNEGREPPHIHVEAGERLAKFWLQSVALSSSTRFKPHDLTEVQEIVAENQARFLAAWHEHFDD